jgi:predicted nucleic acid-binding protein
MTRETTDVYVLDTSALVALIEAEEGADIVRELLKQAYFGNIMIIVSFMTYMEIYYIALMEYDENEARERLNLLNSLPISRVESKEDMGVMASKIKANHYLSVADAWIAALAKQRNAILVHKDPEFEQIESEIQVLKLPYKAKV